MITSSDFESKVQAMKYMVSVGQFFEFQADVVIHTIPVIPNQAIFQLKVYPFLKLLFRIQTSSYDKFRVKCYEDFTCLDGLDFQLDHVYQIIIRKSADENDEGLIKFEFLLNGQILHSKKLNQTIGDPNLTIVVWKKFMENFGHVENIKLLSFDKTETKDVKCDPGILSWSGSPLAPGTL